MKVARKLKYFSPETDLDALAKELSGNAEDEEKPEREEFSWDEDDRD